MNLLRFQGCYEFTGTYNRETGTPCVPVYGVSRGTTMDNTITPLSPDQLRAVVDPGQFKFASTAELTPLAEIIGQPRATRAIEFGLEVPSFGFNIYVLGPAGAGKTAVVQQFLQAKAAERPVPDDWCYVNNFADSYRPRALRVPAGLGCRLRDDMHVLVRQLQVDLPRLFGSEEYAQRKQDLLRTFQEQRSAQLEKMEAFARERGFAILSGPSGLVFAPMIKGHIVTPEEYQTLDPTIKQEIDAQQPVLQEEMDKTVRIVREIDRQAHAAVEKLDREVTASAVDHLIEELAERYDALPAVLQYLDAVREDIIQNAAMFLPVEASQSPQPAPPVPRARSPFDRYRVNVIVDNCNTQGAPVVVERNPTYANLIGHIEHTAEFGTLTTDFTMIKPGALHRANGGYLVLEAASLFKNPMSWDALKRSLQERSVKIEEMGAEMRVLTTVSLEPEPVPLDVKVVLIGDGGVYYLLHALDEEFRQLFKVQADFDVDMLRTPEAIDQYARFVAARCTEEGLRHFTPGAVAQVVEHGSRLIEDQTRLTTRFADIADLIREASYWAAEAGHPLVTADDVRQAVAEKVYRENRIEERIREFIKDGTIRVATEGTAIGQVNGISVLELTDYAFGRPSRITARSYAGKEGVLNIDREAKLSGPIHDKGMMILTGFLGGRYAQNHPLSLSATIVFEQAYEEVEGDSASSSELYALLSSLSGLPIQQGIAVTGSVDQAGNIQAVGGVTPKIEGFFDVCRVKGLTGRQGVIIPVANMRNLMLREDVVIAVREGQFHVWPVRTIDEGITLLTGVPAGELDAEGRYPEGTVNRRVADRIRELAEIAREFGEEGPPGPGGDNDREQDGRADVMRDA